MLATLAFITFIRENPGFTAWLIGVLGFVIATLVGVAWTLIYHRLGRVEDRVELVESEVETVKAELDRYEDKVGLGERSLNALTNTLAGISTQLNELQVENTNAHADIIENHGERLAKIEERVEYIRRGMPNGDIATALVLLRKLVAAKE